MEVYFYSTVRHCLYTEGNHHYLMKYNIQLISPIPGKWGKIIGSHVVSSRFVRTSRERSKSQTGRFTNFETAASI